VALDGAGAGGVVGGARVGDVTVGWTVDAEG